jgi:hypothetical protein
MADRSRAPIIGLGVLLIAFAMKDFFLPADVQPEENSVQSKEIPSLHFNRFAGPSIKFTFWLK